MSGSGPTTKPALVKSITLSPAGSWGATPVGRPIRIAGFGERDPIGTREGTRRPVRLGHLVAYERRGNVDLQGIVMPCSVPFRVSRWESAT